ncbi:helix-turn-helix transcriptional regulator [Saccharopolyspora sp. ID03-671]|uniref:helix-turn-helix domain-containing protein n=1 Tax=Saccharopolyspora sp. ID03-671 TaxID=3073066 RepID=UPI00325021B0
MEAEGGESPHEAFAIKLNRLFKSVRSETGEAYTPRAVSEALTQRGRKISPSYLYQLLKGESEPGYAVVEALAEFFDVPLDYFANSARGRELNTQYEVLAKLGDNNVRELAFRAQNLTPEGLRNVLRYMEFEEHRTKDDEHTSE